MVYYQKYSSFLDWDDNLVEGYKNNFLNFSGFAMNPVCMIIIVICPY